MVKVERGGAGSLSFALRAAAGGGWRAAFSPRRHPTGASVTSGLHVPLSIRALTADGRLDAVLPAELSLEVATEASAREARCGLARTAGEIESLMISAQYFGAAAVGPSPGVIPPLEANQGFSLQVWRAPESPDRIAAKFRTEALEQRTLGLTPPLDATLDAADASCVVFTPWVEVVEEKESP
jgi:hypothetical protein